MEVKAHSGFHDLFRKYTTPSEDIITGGKLIVETAGEL
jgi:hypothetical protein